MTASEDPKGSGDHYEENQNHSIESLSHHEMRLVDVWTLNDFTISGEIPEESKLKKKKVSLEPGGKGLLLTWWQNS